MRSSLSKSAKGEALKKRPEQECCNLAFLSAVIHTAGTLVIAKNKITVKIKTSGDLFNKFIEHSLQKLYGISPVFKKDEAVIVGENVVNILTDAGILKPDGNLTIVPGIDPLFGESECCIAAYVKGAFIGGGSLSVSRSGYHLEFSLSNPEFAFDLINLLANFGISAKFTERKSKYIVYIKDSAQVVDCVALTGAARVALEISGMFVQRHASQQSNRRSNCDLANLDRTVGAGVRQKELFEGIIGGLSEEKLIATALARIDSPEASYGQLAVALGVSKSCVKHRLKKLEEIARTRDKE